MKHGYYCGACREVLDEEICPKHKERALHQGLVKYNGDIILLTPIPIAFHGILLALNDENNELKQEIVTLAEELATHRHKEDE